MFARDTLVRIGSAVRVLSLVVLPTAACVSLSGTTTGSPRSPSPERGVGTVPPPSVAIPTDAAGAPVRIVWMGDHYYSPATLTIPVGTARDADLTCTWQRRCVTPFASTLPAVVISIPGSSTSVNSRVPLPRQHRHDVEPQLIDDAGQQIVPVDGGERGRWIIAATLQTPPEASVSYRLGQQNVYRTRCGSEDAT